MNIRRWLSPKPQGEVLRTLGTIITSPQRKQGLIIKLRDHSGDFEVYITTRAVVRDLLLCRRAGCLA